MGISVEWLTKRFLKVSAALAVDPSGAVLLATLAAEAIDGGHELYDQAGKKAVINMIMAHLSQHEAQLRLLKPLADIMAKAGIDADQLAAMDAHQLAKLLPNSLRKTANSFAEDFSEEFQLLDLREKKPHKLQRQPSYLLDARHAVVPFTGRVAEQEDLRQWGEDSEPLLARLYTGGGGMGKSRLFQHIAEQWRAKGWIGGFVKENAPSAPLQRLLGYGDNLLLILDYAETHTDQVAALIEAAENAARDGRRIRLILLARGEGDWLKKLERSTDGLALQAILLAPYSMEVSERQDAFWKAQKAFREKLKFADDEVSPPDLSKDTFQRILFIQMSALAAAYGKTIENEIGLLDFALEHEKKIWDKQKFNIDEDAIHQATALMTLAGRVDEKASVDLLQKAPDLADQPREKLKTIAKRLHALYPGPAYLNGVQPDLLGEHLVARALGERPNPDLLAALLDAVPNEWKKQALTVLDRMAAIHPDCAAAALTAALTGRMEDLLAQVVAVAQETGGIVGDVAAQILNDDPQPKAALAVYDNLPGQSVALRRLAAVVTAQVLALLPVESADEEGQNLRAALLNNLAYRCSTLGQKDGALAAIREAVEIRRNLAQRHPDAFLPALALSLNNLANSLSEHGRKDEALAHAQEAVEIRRALAQRHPDAFLPALAMSLNNLGKFFSELGQKDAALARAQEAVEICRKLAQLDPDAFLPYLAMSLYNLSSDLSDFGRKDEALAAAEGAMKIHRELAQRDPDAFLPDLAASLNNLGKFLSDHGRMDAALAATKESVEIRRNLAQRHPDAFLSDLAMSLNNLANRLSALGQKDAALTHAQEAVVICRNLATHHPDAFLPDLAVSLNNLVKFLSDLGRTDEALTAAEESVEIRRNLAQRHPDAFLPDLAVSLNNLANILSENGRKDAALAASHEAVEILSPYFLRYPPAFAQNMGFMLQVYIGAAEALGQEPDIARFGPVVEVLGPLLAAQVPPPSG
jgi:HEPN domain-containing protein